MMATPRRRSSRLRGASATPGKLMNNASLRLSSLAERDESPTSGPQSNLDAIASSPLAPRTPATAGRVQPSKEDMHPSKAQQSTTKQPDSGLRLGFTDINDKTTNQPSGVSQQTPSKSGISSSFDFRFAHASPKLGPEAQRLMDELRGEAQRIKEKLTAEKEAEEGSAGEHSNIATRRYAQPKGKVGRFSDVHMAEFKKMDSIAGHPSAFRAQLGRLAPAKTGLKRSQSKAELDDRDEGHSSPGSGKSRAPKIIENQAPTKRARQHVDHDTSTARPISRDGGLVVKQPTTPTSSRSQPNILASLTTPTQASLARATSIKNISSQIPTMSRSPSKPNLANTPRGLTKSATTNSTLDAGKSETNLQSPSKLSRVKSILRNTGFSAKKPSTNSSIPTLARSPSKPNLDKGLPALPDTPNDAARSKFVKYVNFTPDTVNKMAPAIQNSPSPVKSGIPRSISRCNLGTKTTAQKESEELSTANAVAYPSLDGIQSLDPVEYPSLAGVRPLPEPPRQPTARTPPPPSVLGTFTFRSDHTINFGTSPNGFGSSPGQASLRQVRPSIFPGDMLGSFPGSNKENIDTMPSVPHGMSNKKRHRVDSDDEQEECAERSPKKHKTHATEGSKLGAPGVQAGAKTPSKVQSAMKKKGGISLSRLNMLAKPKSRK